MNSELIALCKDLLLVKQQLKDAEIKKSILHKKRVELEKTLNEKMKQQKLDSLTLTGVGQFSVLDQILGGVLRHMIKIKRVGDNVKRPQI